MNGGYYIMLQGKSLGPLTPVHFRKLHAAGMVTRATFVREHGSRDTRPLCRHKELATAIWGSKAPLVALRGSVEEYRARPLVGVAASVLAGLLASLG